MFVVGIGMFIQAHAQSKGEALFLAVQTSNLDEAIQLLEAGAPVDGIDDHDRTPLNYACALDNMEFINVLIRYGASVNGFSETEPPLYTAVKHNSHKPIMLLMQSGADLSVMRESDGNAVYLAARYNKAAAIRILLSKGALTHLPKMGGNSSVHVAAQYGSSDAMNALLGAGGRSHSDLNEKGKTPLHLAAEHGHAEICAQLLKAGADPNSLDQQNRIPLHFAAMNDHKLAAIRLLEAGANPNIPDAQGNFPIHYAAKAGNSSLTLSLVGYGADVNALNAHGQSPLVIATNKGMAMLCRALVKNGASMGQAGYPKALSAIIQGGRTASDADAFSKANADGSFGGRTYLSWAIAAGESGMVGKLLELGAAYDVEDEADPLNLPLHLAAMGDRVDVAELLTAMGADINAQNDEGETALHLALRSRRIKMVRWLLQRGARTDIRAKGTLPMIEALKAGPAMTQLMLEAGEKLEVLDTHDNWPVHLAVQSGKMTFLEMILQQGVQVNNKNDLGMTALHLATKAGREDMVRELLRKGADVSLTTNEGLTAMEVAVQTFNLKLIPILR